MGRSFYVRASGDNVYPIVQTVTPVVIGYDALPDKIKQSEILSAADIATLASVHELPTQEQIDAIALDGDAALMAKDYLSEGEKEKALAVLLK